MGELAHTQQLDSMSGKEFEELIAQLVRKLGFEIEWQSTGPDGGIDILAKSEAALVSGHYVIQCKRYSKKVGVGAVRDLFGVVSDKRVNKGILITNAEFTKAAVEFASGNPIELIGGSKLSVLLEKHLGEMFQPGGEGITLPPPLVLLVKFIATSYRQFKKLIDEQQIQIDQNLILIKPITFLNVAEESNFLKQHWDSFTRTYTVFGNQLLHPWGSETLEELQEEVRKGFALIRKSLKEFLRLQLELHGVQPLGDELYERAFAQVGRVYSTLFDILSDSLGTTLDSFQELLESPEKFIAAKSQTKHIGKLQKNELKGTTDLQEKIRLIPGWTFDLTDLSKEIDKLVDIFDPT